MYSSLLNRKLYRACEWATRLAYINILWLIFTLFGAIIFGIVPATVALFTIVRKWLLSHDDVPVFQTFIQTYKKEFLQANRFGLLIMIVAYILYIDVLLYIAYIPASFQFLVSVMLFIIFIFYAVTLLYMFPIYVHYELRFWQYIRYAFLLGMAHPLMTLIMLVSIGILSAVFMYIPSIIPFFGGSLFSLIIMSNALRVFQKIEEKQAIWQQGK